MRIDASTFYQTIAHYLESKVRELDETGFVNAIVGFKMINYSGRLPILYVLENILIGNIERFDMNSLSLLMFSYTS